MGDEGELIFGADGSVRRPNHEDARRYEAVEMLKRHVRAQRPDANYEADIEYLDRAILAFADEWVATHPVTKAASSVRDAMPQKR